MFTCICVCVVCVIHKGLACVDHDLIIREYKYGVHNARSAPVICPLNPTTVCTVSQVKMYCKRGNSN